MPVAAVSVASMVVVVRGSIKATSGTTVLADDGDFGFLVAVGDNRKLGHVRGGTGGRGDADQGGARNIDPVDAFVFEDMPAVGGDDSDAFGAVHGAAAAHGHDDVAALLGIVFNPQHDFLGPGVGADVGKDGVGHLGGGERCQDFLRPSRLHDLRVGNQQDFGCPQVAGIATGQTDGAVTQYDIIVAWPRGISP